MHVEFIDICFYISKANSLKVQGMQPKYTWYIQEKNTLQDKNEESEYKNLQS